jgi:hypothetical protein
MPSRSADQAQAATTNTVATLQQLTERFQSNPELAPRSIPRACRAMPMRLEKGPFGWKDLKDFRSIIGEKIGELRLRRGSQHKRSSRALCGLVGGYALVRRGPWARKGARRVRPGQQPLPRRAELIDQALTRILGKDGKLAPEKAAAAIQAMTKGGKSSGDLRTLAEIRARRSRAARGMKSLRP